MPIDQKERERRSALLRQHLDAENRGDVAAIMETFGPEAEMNYNATPFPRQAIQAAHEYLGFTQVQGAFGSPQNHIVRESFTDTEVVVEGFLRGAHERDFLGFKATGRPVELPFVAFYCFGEDGRLTSERVVMNLGPLHEGYYAAPPGMI